jgi:hypothetical protein
MTANPRWPAGLRTTWIVVRSMRDAQSSNRPANALSANTNRTGEAR